MKSFQIQLTKEVKDELFSDLSKPLVMLMLIEAVLNTDTGPEEGLDPEARFEESLQDIIEAVKASETAQLLKDEEDESTEGEEDDNELDDEFIDILTANLVLAIETIQRHNKTEDLIVIKSEFKELDTKGGVNYSATPLDNSIIFCIGEAAKK